MVLKTQSNSYFRRVRPTPAERRTLQHITRGLPQVHRSVLSWRRVYRLFDRPCHTDTALAKLAKLRQRVRRFKPVGKIVNKRRSPQFRQGADVSR